MFKTDLKDLRQGRKKIQKKNERAYSKLSNYYIKINYNKFTMDDNQKNYNYDNK